MASDQLMNIWFSFICASLDPGVALTNFSSPLKMNTSVSFPKRDGERVSPVWPLCRAGPHATSCAVTFCPYLFMWFEMPLI